MIDSHCHLQSLAADECERALDRARERGVEGFLVPAIRLSDADRLLDLCARHGDMWCSLGVHPHEAESWRDGDSDRLRALLDAPGVVAVGECGLDFHYDLSPRDVQERVMREQWDLALEVGLPVIVHNRASDDRMRAVLADPVYAGLQADFHSYAGDDQLLDVVLERGFAVGISGMITFKNAENIRSIARRAPRDRLLVETDTPYLAPVPYRGKPNEPAYVVEVLEGLAGTLVEDPRAMDEETSANFARYFPRASQHREGQHSND